MTVTNQTGRCRIIPIKKQQHQQQLTKCKLVLLLSSFLLSAPPSCHVHASTLVKQDYRLGTGTITDSSDMTFGGGAGVYSVSGSCSYSTYYDQCSSVTGERVWKSASGQTTSYIFSEDGNEVTSCNRYRQESSCNNCVFGNCVVSTSTIYGGSTITYSLTYERGSVASLPVSRELFGACTNACMENGRVVTPPGQTCVPIQGGWFAVNDNYDQKCAVQQTCDRVEVNQGCEDTYMGSVAGTYQPLSSSSDECSGVDQTRSIYKKNGSGGGSDIYLFWNGSQWKFLKQMCSNIFTTNAAYIDGGDEPYLTDDTRIECYDGGFGSNKDYAYTDFSIECKRSGGSGSSGYTPLGGGGGGESGAFVNYRANHNAMVFLTMSMAMTSIFMISY